MLALLLAAATAVQLTPESALPREVARDLAERAETLPEAFENCGARLGLGDPVPLDETGSRLLMGGTLGAGAVGPFRSVALLSEDAGHTWREVMTPAGGCEVSQIVRLRGDVWALVAFAVEGPGPVDVVHSSDGGRTWETLATVDKRLPLGIVGELAFTDAQHGGLVVDYEGWEDARPADLQVTTDGGRTWRVAGPAAVAAGGPVEAGEWRLSPSSDGAAAVERRPPGTTAWQRVTVVPTRWQRTPDGRLEACPVAAPRR